MCKEVIEMFVKNGRVQDALGEASRYGDVLAISDLVRQGANVNLPNSLGSPIINLAASGGSVQAIEALLALGADPNQVCDKSGEHSLFRCLWANHDLETYVACCSVLIASGASIHLRNRDGLLVGDLATQRGVSLASIEDSLS